MRINKGTMVVIKTTTGAKITFKKMGVDYRDNAEMFAAIDVVVTPWTVWQMRPLHLKLKPRS